jgi:penicillin-binding protein 1C
VPHAPPSSNPLPKSGRGRRWAALALVPLVVFYVGTVLSRAHFVAPSPTPIIYDRHGVFLAQFGDVLPAPADGSLPALAGSRDLAIVAGGRDLPTRASRDLPTGANRNLSTDTNGNLPTGAGRNLTEYGYWPVDPAPPRVVRATLALEDRHFWSHPGVDPGAVLRAVWQDLAGLRRRSGASTVAMQVARMQHPAPRTLWAKLVEAGTALALTTRYGRAAVLAQYLRLVPYGNGSHGIGHAARWYFGKPAADLSWAEIALLCAVPRAPAAYNPLHPTGLQRARARAGRILDALRAQAVLSEGEYQAASAQLVTLQPGPAPHRPPDALHPILHLRDLLAQEPSPSPASDDRVTASLDLSVQHVVATLLRAQLATWRGAGAQQAAAIVVARGSNAVLAAVGSDGYGDARGGAIDFTRAIRSPGSTLKPFLYAAALQRGLLHPADMLLDAPGRSGGIGNADARYLGAVPPRQALANSRNVPAVDVLRRLGLGAGFDLFRTLGLHALDAAPDSLGLSMAIGALPTSLDRLAGAYTALADDGVEHALRWYRGQPEAPPRRVFSATAAREVGLFLSDPLARLPSFARYGSTEYPFAVAVKTGTSQGYRDAWTVAWSPQFLVAAWVGRSDAGTMAGLGGVNSAANLVRAILLTLHHQVAGELSDTDLAVPDGYVPVPVCAGPAETAEDSCGGRTLLEWLPRYQPGPVSASAPTAFGSPPASPGPAPSPASVASRAPTASLGSVASLAPVASPTPTSSTASAGSPRPGPAPFPKSALPQEALPPDASVRLSVVTPEGGSRIWRNPESPPAADRLVLRAKTIPHVPQIVWFVDGEPFALSDPDAPVTWKLHVGLHHFQIGLPLRPERSRPVSLVVE